MAAVIKARQLRNPLVVGWSFGGYVVVNYVQHHGGRGIAGAVPAGSNAGMLPPPTDPKAIAQMAAQRAANATNHLLPVYARRAMSARSLQADDAVPLMTTPMLLLVGDQDGSQSVEALTGLARRLPDGSTKVMPGAGHAAFIDSPQEFDDAPREFEACAATRR